MAETAVWSISFGHKNTAIHQSELRYSLGPLPVAHLSGFEPKAFRLGGGRSILLSYRNINFINNIPSNLFIITDLTKVSQDLSCNFCERFL